MKLLSKTESGSKIKKENDELIETNIRLRKYYADILLKLNTIKENYDPEKMAKLKEFEVFCKDLNDKKDKLFQEFNALEAEIQKKKDIYYGFIERMDELTEKEYQIEEANKKLNLREVFVGDLEEKFREKQLSESN